MADPKTCLHKVIAIETPFFWCTSCRTPFTRDNLKATGRRFEYDINTNVLVHIPTGRVERP